MSVLFDRDVAIGGVDIADISHVSREVIELIDVLDYR
jgi:ribosome maturation factor RimP